MSYIYNTDMANAACEIVMFVDLGGVTYIYSGIYCDTFFILFFITYLLL